MDEPGKYGSLDRERRKRDESQIPMSRHFAGLRGGDVLPATQFVPVDMANQKTLTHRAGFTPDPQIQKVAKGKKTQGQ
jgi:hypothetical protein